MKIRGMKNGPFLVQGDGTYVIVREGKEERIEKKSIALCRCGRSAHKPFCDGTHKQIDFSAEEVEIRIE